MCGGAIGDIFQGIDKVANTINPLKGAMQWATDNTLGKLPGIGKPLAQLGDYGINHPLESLGAAAAAYGTFGGSLAGAGALGADAGAAGADGLGAGAAEVGASGGGEVAASTASGFGGVGTDAGVAGAGGGAVTTASGFGGVGTDAAVTAPAGAATGSGLSGLGKTALQVLGPAVASSLLAPKPPKTKAVSLMPDPLAEQQAAQQRLLTQMAQRGRASTILTSPGGSGSLGG